MNNCSLNIMEKSTILSLLPYAENTQLISKQQKLDFLHLLNKVTNFSIMALEIFLKGNLVSFDAQVGENLCQIRAYRILHLARKWLNKSTLKQEFKKKIEHLIKYRNHLQKVVEEWEQTLKLSKTFNKNLDSLENISDFFARQNLSFELDEELIFIIVCNFLTQFNIKDNNIPVAINIPQIASEFVISKYRAKRLSHRYQQLICKSGCDFIMQIANELSEDYGYSEILPCLYKIADEDRAVLPCHIVSEIIFNHATLEKMPVLLKVNRFCSNHTTHYDTILFNLLGKREDETQFSHIPCELNSTEYCMVVSGETHDIADDAPEPVKNYIHRLLSETPLKLILANTAIHPQYSGKRLEALQDNPFRDMLSDSKQAFVSKRAKELVLMQQFAFNSGCSRQNPTTFFLKHVYANTILNEINELNFIHTGCAYRAIKEKDSLLGTVGRDYDNKETISFNSA